jgi:hypothetical protein
MGHEPVYFGAWLGVAGDCVAEDDLGIEKQI